MTYNYIRLLFCANLKSMLDQPINMLACRRHIGETLLRNVWTASSIESSKAPKSLLFGKFQACWDEIENFQTDCLYLPLLGSADSLVDDLKIAQKSKMITKKLSICHYGISLGKNALLCVDQVHKATPTILYLADRLSHHCKLI